MQNSTTITKDKNAALPFWLMHRVLLGTLFLICVQPVSADTQPWLIAAENFPPYSYQDESHDISGVAVENAVKLMKTADITYDAQLLPWARVVEYLDKRPNTLTPAMAKTIERAPKYLWLGPFDTLQIFAWTHIDRNIESIPAQNRLVGVIRGSAAEKHLINQVKILDENLLRVNSLEQMVGMLLKKRVDVIYVADNMEAQTRRLSAQLSDFQIEKRELLLEFPLYMAINKSSDKAQVSALVEAAQQLVNHH